ncbi:hypothetical protein Poli38472_006850 [Pythium oligandrum]|uniref:DUF4246 domain-containing protein n=1 Tax=Pythium oligandrum TaxID=41045 RepID=A0A8K1C5Q5_PYTOL|nr:hypothetical protein Poli38472_006850 [Pythium oligandrum]|eukprot:TMW56840.1 hypothetical protein Poli38472_006850 [Pythium oligandrum]
MVIRRETIRLAPHTSRTPTSWLCEWTKNATQPLYATALVVCGLDHISGPGVRFRDRAYGYTQRRPYKISTFWEDPAAAIYRNDGDPYAPVTAHFGRAIVFPVELQYRIDSLKLIDPARAGALTLLVVGMVDDPTVDLGPDRPLVPSFKTESPEFYQCASRIVGLSVSSYESERWEHYKTHLEPA